LKTSSRGRAQGMERGLCGDSLEEVKENRSTSEPTLVPVGALTYTQESRAHTQ
jgi:hypothetical protein